MRPCAQKPFPENQFYDLSGAWNLQSIYYKSAALTSELSEMAIKVCQGVNKFRVI